MALFCIRLYYFVFRCQCMIQKAKFRTIIEFIRDLNELGSSEHVNIFTNGQLAIKEIRNGVVKSSTVRDCKVAWDAEHQMESGICRVSRK